MTCHHAASGCNYPEGECLGLCMNEQQSAAPQSAVSPYERPCQFGLEAEQPSAEPVEFLLNGARLKLSFQQVQCEDCGTMSDELRAVPLDQYADELQGRWVALVPAEDDRHLRMMPAPPPGAAAQDAARLNWLDRNLQMRIGWHVGKAPAGNITVRSIIQPNGATSIRDAIDAAMQKGGAE